MDTPTLSIRTPSQILAMEFAETDKYLPNGILAKGQPFAIVGPAGIGKSRLLLQLIVCLLTGRPFLGWPVKRHDEKWLIVQTENSNARLQNDLKAMAAWVGKKAFAHVERNLLLHTLQTQEDSFLSLTEEGNELAIDAAIYEHRPVGVVFDPFNAFGIGSLNTDAGMLQTCRKLYGLATALNPSTTPLILHHSLAGKAGMKKAVGADAGSYAKGSKAFTQWIRGQLNVALAGDGGTDLVIACGKNSNGPPFEPFGVMLNPKTMIYEVNPHFDLSEWQASIGITSTVAVRKLNTAAVAALTGPLPTSKNALGQLIMAEYAVGKSRAYEVIVQAEVAGLIVRDGRKLYRAPRPNAV